MSDQQYLLIATIASTTAAIFSAIAAFLTYFEARRASQMQILPSISIEFDPSLGDVPDKLRKAEIRNLSGCDIAELKVNVMTLREDGVAHATTLHDLSRRSYRGFWRKTWTPGAVERIECGEWFSHAMQEAKRSPTSTGFQGRVHLEVSFRRIADQKFFKFHYAYMVLLAPAGKWLALPAFDSGGSPNPADAGKRLILRRVDPQATSSAEASPKDGLGKPATDGIASGSP